MGSVTRNDATTIPITDDSTNGYLPIADHGVIGDLRTAALVGINGRIDWFCCPRFDSPSVFGALLDSGKGGSWDVAMVDGLVSTKQFYLPDSNVLVTRFMSEDGVAEVQDLMPLTKPKDPDHRTRIVRRIECVRGRVTMSMRLDPQFDYGRAERTVEADGDRRFTLSGGDLTLHLAADVPLELADDDTVTATVQLGVGETATFSLGVDEIPDDEVDSVASGHIVHATVRFWQSWLAQSNYKGRWREMVHRSALALKLMTHEPTGAIVASVTTALPEEIGGERNWDYRYVWIRDAAFSLYGLLRLGFNDEAAAFMSWLTDRFSDGGDEDGRPLRLMYTIDGETPPDEHSLEHWEGYRGSTPVNVGNGATNQLQLDIYGELIDSVYLFNKYGAGISYNSWNQLCEVMSWLVDNWDQSDESIWEVRSESQNFVYSRLMCWVAFERMIRMSRQRGLPGDVGTWMATRDEIFHQIMEKGWNDKRQAFTQTFESDHLDASLLLIPAVKLLSPTDPRFLSTLEAIEGQLVSDSLVFRYDASDHDDGLSGTEGTFSLCSFWYVEALTRVGRRADARLALEKMFTHANHLGLYAEQVGLTGEQLGNFPQAFTHLALISAAFNLDRELGA
ncbi:glycoside hydrolase family 15 protein [Williamsia maris]|uniref:Glucoamylase (Glucan-1,4-alpha-glucosidase), GH15 family n=1 Tax=Williamsia maris TaxID=72806 RepID=A0ABT1HJT0_9NOCA|nr:Glucoamylase (glucan-1,4-alpha-glucosidase), GH15 family [Williamsia maris]